MEQENQNGESGVSPEAENRHWSPGGSPERPGHRRIADEPALRRLLSNIGKIFGDEEFLSPEEWNLLRGHFSALGSADSGEEPLRRARDLLHGAVGESRERRVQLARQALEISPYCTEAYVILGTEEARTLEEARRLFEQGVIAGTRNLGVGKLETPRETPEFRNHGEMPAYLRARVGLAECLWEAGDRRGAVAHLKDILRMEPADEAGVRFLLVQRLLESGLEEELGEVLELFRDDPAPELKYTRALWTFRREGPSKQANDLLSEAMEANPYVPDYLLRRKQLPPVPPDFVHQGAEDEAVAYVLGARQIWRRTLGAIEWLASNSTI